MAHKFKTLSWLPALAWLGATLTACSSGGGSVSIANSQPADSQTTDFGIAYVKRMVPTAQDDLRLRRAYQTAADLYLINPTSNGGKEQNITARITSTAPKGMFYDIKDVDVSADGTKLIFAMRGPLTPKQQTQKAPNWNLYEYVPATDFLHLVAPSSDPQGKGAQYISPHYLPDGRILFASTRQIGSSAVLLNEISQDGPKAEMEGQTEDLNESAFVLHVMNADGSGLHQISYNPSHDVDASVLQSGRVLWSRWDHANGKNGIHLYTANPDGTDVQLLFGAGSHTTASTNPGNATTCPTGDDCTVEFARTREMPDGSVLALVRPFTDADFGGSLQIIDVQHYVENNQAIPDTPANAGYSTTNVAQRPASANAVLTATANNLPSISPGGRFSSAFPLWDGTNRILVTWSECRLQDKSNTILACTDANLAQTTGTTPALTPAPPLYSAWMFSPSDNTFKPLLTPTEGVMVTDIVALQPRTAQGSISDSYSLSSAAPGILDIRSVYDWDGAPWSGLTTAYTLNSGGCAAAGNIAGMAQLAADCRPARFLRIVKAVGIPPQQAGAGPTTRNFDRGTAFGVAGNYMREILGYVPIEPDGSVRVAIPTNVAFQVDVVSAQVSAGSATGWIWRDSGFQIHRAWLQLLPGETLSCNGCHTPPAAQNAPAGVSTYSHGRQGLFTSIWAGAPAGGFPGTGGTVSTCAGETMAEALTNYQCGANPQAAATLAPAPSFTDPWFGGTGLNESINILGYTDPNYGLSTQIPTYTSCMLSGLWNSSCRIIINYPTKTAATPQTAGSIEPLWSACRMLAPNMPCPSGTAAPGTGTCNTAGCHDNSNTPAAHLSLADGASAANANQENSYQQLTQQATQTSVDPTTGQVITTVLRGAEVNSGSAFGSHLFQVFANPGDPAYPTHVGLLSPAELRLLSEWVDIGAQYYNNPFDAPLNN